MEFDDDGHDDGPVAPLLPPEDRLWRHPSEVATHPIGNAPWRPREPRLMTVVALTASISVLLTLGVVATVRPVRTKLAVEQVAPPADPSRPAGDGADVARITDRIRAAITRITVETNSAQVRRGSAVFYRSDGLLLTAHHVIAGAATVRVMLDDGRELDAEVIGSDAETDVAVLDVEGDGFPIAPLGTASGLKIGQPAIVIGTPATRASPTVSVGVVSATGQAVDLEGRMLVDMIETDATVRDGCSGGALVDSGGVVIGIATINGRDPSTGASYATPIDVARLVAAQLVTHGRVSRGWLGVEGDDLTGDRASAMGVDGGVVVKAVKDASPARAAGLLASDVITELDGEPLESMTELVVQLRTRRPGDTVSIAVVRGGERRMLKATLAAKP